MSLAGTWRAATHSLRGDLSPAHAMPRKLSERIWRRLAAYLPHHSLNMRLSVRRDDNRLLWQTVTIRFSAIT